MEPRNLGIVCPSAGVHAEIGHVSVTLGESLVHTVDGDNDYSLLGMWSNVNPSECGR